MWIQLRYSTAVAVYGTVDTPTHNGGLSAQNGEPLVNNKRPCVVVFCVSYMRRGVEKIRFWCNAAKGLSCSGVNRHCEIARGLCLSAEESRLCQVPKHVPLRMPLLAAYAPYSATIYTAWKPHSRMELVPLPGSLFPKDLT